MNKKDREIVYNKYSGRCAYCGKQIEYKDMQVDHLIPVSNYEGFSNDIINDISNLMPSCRRCNHYKRANSLETFRKYIATIPMKLYRDNYIYKVGVDYGFLSPECQRIKFYFESVENE